MKKDKKSAFAENLKLHRKRMGWTQEAFGKKVGCTRATFQTYESGKNEPSYTRLKIIADVIGVSVHRLLNQRLGSLTETQIETLATGYDQKQWKDKLEMVRP